MNDARSLQMKTFSLLLLGSLALPFSFAHAEEPPTDPVVVAAPVVVVSAESAIATECASDLSGKKISKRLPSYFKYRALFRALDPSKAFAALRLNLGREKTAAAKLSAMIAFLDYSNEIYGTAVDNLASFNVAYTSEPISDSHWVKWVRNKTFKIGRGAPKKDLEVAQALMSIARGLSIAPLNSEVWPWPWRNGLSTLPFRRNPREAYVAEAEKQVEIGGQHLVQTYDFLRSIVPSLKEKTIASSPGLISYREVLWGTIAAALPVAQDLYFHESLLHDLRPEMAAVTVMAVLYSPIHGRMVEAGSAIRSRLNAYWFSSNLARVLVLAYAAHWGYDTYNMFTAPDEPVATSSARAESDEERANDKKSLDEQIESARTVVSQRKQMIVERPNDVNLRLHLKVEEESLNNLIALQSKRERK